MEAVMKRFALILLALALTFTFVACQNAKDDTPATSSTESVGGDNDVVMPDSWFADDEK